VNNFAGQWLYLRNVQEATRDPRLFPDFDDNLRQSFRRETELFFESIVREDRSVLDLLRANYTFVNERLARHYGIPNIYGSHFRRVAFDEDSVRGGLLGHGSILMATSYANRTSPVQRGKWVLRTCSACRRRQRRDAPPLKDSTPGKVLTMRERMIEHRTNPICSSCHQLMDPIGLATETRCRRPLADRQRDRRGDRRVGRPARRQHVRRSGGVAEALLHHSDLFVATTTEKLLTYALGRGLEAYDGAAVRAILQAAEPSEALFRDRRRDRQQHAVPAQEVRVIVRKIALPRRTFSWGGRRARLRCSNRWSCDVRARPDSGGARPAARVRLHPDGIVSAVVETGG
jgi:hypothetical protein